MRRPFTSGTLTSLHASWYVAGPCPCGGIGRRARLKIEFRKECWFDPGQGHHRLSDGSVERRHTFNCPKKVKPSADPAVERDWLLCCLNGLSLSSYLIFHIE
jgi:hypothetical protein